MANVRVHNVTVTRIPALPKVRIHDVTVSRITPPPPPAVVRIHDVWVTHGFAPPRTNGALWYRVGGTWVKYRLRVKFNGGWH